MGGWDGTSGQSCEENKDIMIKIDGPAFTLATLIKNATSPMLLITGGSNGAGCVQWQLEIASGVWYNIPYALSEIPPGLGLLLPATIKAKAVSKACGTWGDEHHCYGPGSVSFRIVPVNAVGTPGTFVPYGNNNASAECTTRILLFPDTSTLKCAACDLKQNFSLAFNEDSGCTGFTPSDYIELKGNSNETHKYSSLEEGDAFNSSLRQMFKDKVNEVLTGYEKAISVQTFEGQQVRCILAKTRQRQTRGFPEWR
jgi:hypothetical protein